MGNSLLDFVMALVRDPEVSARYAADPVGVLAEARLPGVTITDVNNLIPVVADSLAASTPGFGASTDSGADSGNVWSSGAAAAALDAFDIGSALPDRPYGQAVTVPNTEIHTDQSADQPAPGYQVELAEVPALDEMPTHPALDSVSPAWADESAMQDPAFDPQHHPGDPSRFDLF
ncbi:MAG: Rv0340 family protein [Mycobacterium sp.]|nr:Rv0340 family protein [Mycobacterium sp.]